MKTHQKLFRRKVLFLFIQLVLWLLPLLILFLFECSLRFLNKGEDRQPLIQKHFSTLTLSVPNRSFYQQFFNIPLHDFVNWDHLDFYVPEQKNKDTLRIFVFGESAMYGLESSVRQLEVILKYSIPEKNWEIYNVSCPGINSHVLYFLAKACSKLSPDFFIIYMGNNETIGPYGEHSLLYSVPFLRTNTMIRLHTYLKHLRMVQLFEQSQSTKWREQKPKDLFPFLPKQGQGKRTLKLYKNNLRDMIYAGMYAHADVIVGTLSYNRKFGKKKEEWDTIRFEPTEMNKCIVDTCKIFSKNVHLVDVDGILAKKSPQGIPGYEYFCDNIHFTFEGNYLLACEWFKAISTILKKRNIITEKGDIPLISMEDCSHYLGWNHATELLQLQMQKAVIIDPISQEIISEKEKQLTEELGDKIEEKIVEGYMYAYKLNQNDEKINMQLIDWLLKTKNIAQANEVAQEFLKKHP
ncbi:MAG: hypothetical protein ACP5KS_10170, partial [Candidatus Hydrogenedens sp.]